MDCIHLAQDPQDGDQGRELEHGNESVRSCWEILE
jgi:hypothetical protein